MYQSKPLNRFCFVVLILLIVASLPSMHASAIMAKCRTDPKFFLSNGDKVTVVLDIDTNEANVLSVNYIVHVPADILLDHVVFTAGGIGESETYSIVQDSSADTYTTETLLLTKQYVVKVVATTSLNSMVIKSASGYSGENLPVTLSTGDIDEITNIDANQNEDGQ